MTSGTLQRHRQEVHGTVQRCPLCHQYIRSDGLLSHNVKKHGIESGELLKRRALQCSRCHNTVLARNICTHLNRVHKVPLDTSRGRHPVAAAIRYQRDRFWLIDGLNIVRLLGEPAPRFDFLLALTYQMLQDDLDFLCVYDASILPDLRELQGAYFADLCAELTQSWPQRFSEVPLRTVADEAILDVATMLGQNILTNDQFRDHADRYPWLETDRQQRLCGVRLRQGSRPHQELLVWDGTSVPVPAPQTIRTFIEEYKELIAKREANRSTVWL